MANYADAIAGIESSGRYDLVGPTHPKYGRALGKYQVMESNLPQWSQKYLGRQITPEEFLSSREAQDAIFQGEFGRLAAKHGPEGAARAWFAGEGGMHDDSRKDSLGTSVADYARKFNAAYGGGDGSAPAAPPAGLLDQPAADPQQAAQVQGLLAQLTSGAPSPAEGQSQNAGLLGSLGGGQQQQPQQQEHPAPSFEAPQMMRKRPIDLSRLQAMIKRPGLRASFWS